MAKEEPSPRASEHTSAVGAAPTLGTHYLTAEHRLGRRQVARAVVAPIDASRSPAGVIPRRELLTLLTYLDAGSHKAAAHRLGIAESTCRQRISRLAGRVGARNAAQAAWRLRGDLEAEVASTT